MTFKTILVSIPAFALIALSSASANTVTATTLKLTAYQLWASTDATNCSNPVKVIDNGPSGKEVDIAQSTDFGSATLPPDGTYTCLIAVVDDRYTIIPAITGDGSGQANTNCHSGVTYTQDTCASGTFTLPDGTSTTCSSGTKDKIAAYISTAGADGNDGQDAAHAKKLNSSITVSGGSVDVTLYVTNPHGLVDQSGSCGQDASAVLGVR